MHVKEHNYSHPYCMDEIFFFLILCCHLWQLKVKYHAALQHCDDPFILLQKSLEIDPDYYEVYFNLGNLVSDEGNHAEAAALYARSESQTQF